MHSVIRSKTKTVSKNNLCDTIRIGMLTDYLVDTLTDN